MRERWARPVGRTIAGALFLGVLSVACAGGSTALAQQCGDWQRVDSPDKGADSNVFDDVTVLDNGELWVVGTSRTLPDPAFVVFMRREGQGWVEVAGPDTSAYPGAGDFDNLRGQPGGGFWAGGAIDVGGRVDPLVAHRDGAGWDHVEAVELRPQTVYPFAGRGGRVYAIDGISPGDVWAVGRGDGFGDGGATAVPIALHWNGSSWTEVDVPVPYSERSRALFAVSAAAPDDAWAVGERKPKSGAFTGLIYHWDGTGWIEVDHPARTIFQSFLRDVEVVAPDDVWAVGEQPGSALIMHWDGTAWSLVDSGIPQVTRLDEISAISPDDIWAVSTTNESPYWHWDGVSWSEVQSPQYPGATAVSRHGGLEAAGPCEVWAVGSLTPGPDLPSETLVERLTASPVPCNSPADCDDGLFCNGQEQCIAQACEPGTPPCTSTTCDEDLDVCNDCTPGAVEINDALDNQDCLDDPGHGLVDEISGSSGFFDPLDKAHLSWPAQEFATEYAVARADTPDMLDGCRRELATASFLRDPDIPRPGQAFFYVIQARQPNTGSWGVDSSRSERHPQCE